MPLIPDYSRDEEERIGGGGGGSSGGGGARLAQSTPQQEETFTPWSRFVSANQEVSQREAGKLAGGVQSQVSGVTQRRDTASEKQSDAIAQNYTGYQPKGQPAQAFGRPKAQSADAGATFGSGPASFSGGEQTQNAVMRPPEPEPMTAEDTAPSNGLKGYEGLQRVADNPTTLDPDRLWHNPTTERSEGFGLTGSKSLEAQMGAPAWASLIGDTMKAGQAATALGSQGGIEALLEQNAPSPNSAFDAALIGGAGGQQFRDIAEQFGGDVLGQQLSGANQSAMDAWSSLMGDVDAAAKQRDAEINAYNDSLRANAASGGAAVPDAAAESRSWLEQNFPIAEQFQTQDGLLDWIEDNRSGDKGANAQTGGYSNLLAWADQIYGGATQENVDQLYADIRKMTPEEYEAFKYGIVPDWMGQGSKASGFNGGGFFGLGNTGQRFKAETTNQATPENQKFWSTWKSAMDAYYAALAAVAGAGNPIAGALAGGVVAGNKLATG